MRFRYSTTDPRQSELDSLPRIPLTLRNGNRTVESIGLVDSGATVNVLPYDLGIQLGAVWDASKANLRLSGSLGDQIAMPLFAAAEIDGLPTARLAFAWIKNNNAPLVLGQTNFFMEFDVHFYRSTLDFEIVPRSSPRSV
jgi:hypothetical protein